MGFGVMWEGCGWGFGLVLVGLRGLWGNSWGCVEVLGGFSLSSHC
jgi:hypothetical protein